MKKLIAILLAVTMIMAFALTASADEVSYTAELNVNWDSNPRSTAAITGPGVYTLEVDMTYWGEGTAGYAAIVIADAYEALKDYTANVSVVIGEATVHDAAITPMPQYVDDGTGNYVANNNYYIELYASWNASNMLESIPYGSKMVITITLTDPNAVEDTTASTGEATTKPVEKPDTTNPKDGDSISVFVALLAVSACGIAVIGKKKF